MKNQVGRLALIGTAAFLLNGWVLADTAGTTNATPGTPAATDSKTQENNPVGTTAQTTAHPKEGTKKKKHKTHAPAPVANQAGDTTSKAPQSESSPATNSGTAMPKTNTP